MIYKWIDSITSWRKYSFTKQRNIALTECRSYESSYDLLNSENRIRTSKHSHIWKHQGQHATWPYMVTKRANVTKWGNSLETCFSVTHTARTGNDPHYCFLELYKRRKLNAPQQISRFSHIWLTFKDIWDLRHPT